MCRISSRTLGLGTLLRASAGECSPRRKACRVERSKRARPSRKSSASTQPAEKMSMAGVSSAFPPPALAASADAREQKRSGAT